VWDAKTSESECLDIIGGSGDVKAIAAGPSKFPFRGVARVHETVIEQSENGKPVAWFPVPFTHIVTHPFDRTWAGVAGGYLYIISLEGIGQSTRQ
jgi:hypothetical protein